MSTAAFIGKISVSSLNNELYWSEQTSGANTATINNGEYYPEELCTAISAAMSNNSVAGNTYACSFDVPTGKFTVDRVGGTEDFAIDPRSSQTGNLWIGGSEDSDGVAWSNGNRGPLALGWVAASAITSYDSAQEAPNMTGGVWYPEERLQDDNEGADDSVIAQSRAIDGTMKTYDFSGWETSNEAAQYPIKRGKNQTRTWKYQYIETDNRNQYIEWWGAWAKTGGAFRFYPDHSDETVYYQYKLVKESCERRTFVERTVQAYPYFSGEFTARGA